MDTEDLGACLFQNTLYMQWNSESKCKVRMVGMGGEGRLCSWDTSLGLPKKTKWHLTTTCDGVKRSFYLTTKND